MKTRLFPYMSYEEAARLQKTLLDDTVDKALAAPGTDVSIAYAPEGSLGLFRGLYGARIKDFFPQTGADLGERMGRALERAFGMGYTKAAIIGSDIPALSPCLICAAFRRLADHDVVIGPAVDGGYYLIALKCPAPGLFADIAWSGPEVLAATVHKAEALGLKTSLLPALRDVDGPDDLREFLTLPSPHFTGKIPRKWRERR